MVFKPLPRPPRVTGDGERDRFELTRWYDAIWKTFVGIKSINWVAIEFTNSDLEDIETRQHTALQDILQSDDTSTSTTGEKHVTDAQVKKYEDHRNTVTGNPHHVAISELYGALFGTLAYGDFLSYNATSGKWINSKKIGDGTNYTEFETDGTPVFNGDATYWLDIDFPIIIRDVAANWPVLTAVQGNLEMPLWVVDDYHKCEAQELTHNWKEGSTVYFHLHILTETAQATDAYVKFEVEYLVLPESSAPAGTNTTINTGDFLIPAGTAALTHFLVPVAAVDLTGFHIADHILARLKRVAASGTAPTGDVFCGMMQLHIECDTIGSREATTK